MIGGGGVGSFPIAGLVVRGINLPSVTDLVATRAEEFLQPWPWVEFYTITTAQNGILRYVDFQDPDARGSMPDLVPFDGEEYESRKIDRAPIRSAADSITTFDVAFEDILSDFVRIMRDEDGLSQAPLEIAIIPWDLKDQPEIALRERYRIRQSSASMGSNGPTVTVEVGLPSLVDIDIPRFVFDRTRCFNDHNRRFELDSRCRTPSDDFEEGTFQVFGSFENNPSATTWPAAEAKRKFGWYSQNADVMWPANDDGIWKSSFRTVPSVHPTDLWTTMEIDAAQLEWINTGRNGPYMYRKMTGDWDVHTELSLLNHVKVQRLVGFLVQSDTTEGDWLAFGNAETAGSVEVLRLRNTTGNVSADTDDTDLTDGKLQFRLQYEDDIHRFTCYVRPDESSAWVQKFQVTKNMGATIRVGLVGSSDSGLKQFLSVQYRYFRFTLGGPDDCNRSLEDCRDPARDNEHQINVFPNIPHRATNT